MTWPLTLPCKSADILVPNPHPYSLLSTPAQKSTVHSSLLPKMNDLIEGFIRSKLQDDDEETTPPSYTERSTWAEVVGRKKEEEENYEEEKHNGRKSSSEFKRCEQDQQNELVADSDGWVTVGGRQRRSPKKHHQVPTHQWQSYKRPSEHSYGDELGNDIDIEPTEEELSDLSKACRRLWDLDLNRLVPGQDYEINCGEGKRPFQKGDVAENVFFSWVNEDVFKKPTFSQFYVLLDNYNPNQGSSEVVTSQEKQEQVAFIEKISRTAPIKYLHKYLLAKRLASHNYEDFKRSMNTLWFDLLDRSGTNDSSSAFEHVFVGEVKRCQVKEVSGFHNWIQFYLEEAKGRIDYQGYIYPRRRGQFPDSESQLLTVQFTWNGVLKSVSSTFIGVSPEFEIALYTLCFFVGSEDNYIELGPYDVNIKCYPLQGNKIGSVFPVALN